MADKIVDANSYFERQQSPQKEICLKLRDIILATFPDIKEAMQWGVPAYADGRYYIVALKDHANLGFTVKNLTKEELALFDGGGKTTRNIQLRSLTDLDQDRIIALLKLVAAK